MFEDKKTYQLRKQELLEITECEFFSQVILEEKERVVFDETLPSDHVEKKEKYQEISNKKLPFVCRSCERKKDCLQVRNKIYKKEGKLIFKGNTAVRFEPNNEIEIVRYHHDYELEIKDELFNNNYFEADRTRLYEETDHGLVPVKDCFTLKKAYESIKCSERRSLQNFYAYALANKWDYFLTLTFDPQYVDRQDRDAVVELWSTFEKWLKRRNPECKILVAPEPHADGSLHFHGFLADCPDITLVPAFNVKESRYIYNKFSGLPTLNLKDWVYGFSTVDVILPADNNLQIANYLSKYITKTESVQYKKKRYFHTRNLDFCSNENYYIDDLEFLDVRKKYSLEIVKERDGMTVYRGVIKTDNIF